MFISIGSRFVYTPPAIASLGQLPGRKPGRFFLGLFSRGCLIFQGDGIEWKHRGGRNGNGARQVLRGQELSALRAFALEVHTPNSNDAETSAEYFPFADMTTGRELGLVAAQAV
jgi:hypothetical protein